MTAIMRDVQYAVRQLRKSPTFSVIAITTLALGVGVNTAIFSVVHAVLLRPLPFAESERLVVGWNRGAEAAGGDRTPLAVSDLLDWRAHGRSLAEVGAFQNGVATCLGSESPERLQTAIVTANFFPILGAQPQFGRNFLPEEEQPRGPKAVILSDGFWRRHFAADPDAVGRTLNLDGELYHIVGIAPANLDFPSRHTALWTAQQLATPTRRGPYFLTAIARLKPSATLEQAVAEINAAKSSLSGDPLNVNVIRINEFVFGSVQLALVVLLAAVTLVLLIAAVNVANLMLVRSATRVREISIRTALGAKGADVIRQLLAESFVLVFAGGTLGALLAAYGVRLLLKMAPDTIPRMNHIAINGPVLGWTALVSLVTGVLFGLAPAWQHSTLSVSEALKEGGRGSTETRGQRRWRSALVVSELALAVMLLVSAGLLIQSFRRLEQVDSGVNTERVLTVHLELPDQRYQHAQQVRTFYAGLLERVTQLPGVQAASLSNSLAPDVTDFSSDFSIEGRATNPNQPPPIAYMIHVSPEYFRASGIALRRGRLFTPDDSEHGLQVVLINETAARQFFPNEDPIGKRVNTANGQEPSWWQIIGVVGDVRYTGLADRLQPTLYQPLVQSPSWDVFLSIKTEARQPLTIADAVRREVRLLDPQLALSEVDTLQHRFEVAVSLPRFRSTLIALFALLAVVLATVGIYGVIAYSVAQRTNEMGIRLALGAQTQRVLLLVLKQGVTLALGGTIIGLCAAFTLTGLMRTLLFNVSASDWRVFGASAGLLILVAIVACYVPARRAARIDPIIALRSE